VCDELWLQRRHRQQTSEVRVRVRDPDRRCRGGFEPAPQMSQGTSQSRKKLRFLSFVLLFGKKGGKKRSLPVMGEYPRLV